MAGHRAIWRLPESARRTLWRNAGYEPSTEQTTAHLDPSRSKLVAGGERAGKSRWTGQEVHDWCWASKDGEVWIVGPTYDLARGDFLHALAVAASTGILVPGSQSVPVQGQCHFTTASGVRVITRTSKDPETLASIAPIGIAMVEAAQQGYEVYLRLRGRVSERRGPIVLSGTFEGSMGWYPELWTRWQAANTEGGRSFSLPTWSNLAIYPGGRDDPEIKGVEAVMPAEMFMERYGAVPCKPATVVFREFSYIEHVHELPFEQGWPVQLWIDPGYAGAYAVLAVQFDQRTIPPTVRVFDEVYRKGVVSADIIDECRERPWWGNVRLVVMDVAGRQHHAQESHYETWRRLTGLVPMGQPVGVADGIQRHRTFLVDPASKTSRLLHDPKCKGTLAEYGLYRYHDIKENRPEREEPIDANNHAMKALAYGLVHNFGFVTAASTQPPKVNVRVRR